MISSKISKYLFGGPKSKKIGKDSLFCDFHHFMNFTRDQNQISL